MSDETKPPEDIEDDSGDELKPGEIAPLDEIPDDETFDGDDVSEEWFPGDPIELSKPEKDDWIAIYSVEGGKPYTPRLLKQKSKADYSPKFYYVAKELQRPIRRSMVRVRVILWYSFLDRMFGLWLQPISHGNSYYESLASLMTAGHEFLSSHEFMVFADQGKRRYRIRKLPIRREVTWPREKLSKLLAAALEDRLILTPDHAVYERLTAGEDVSLHGED